MTMTRFIIPYFLYLAATTTTTTVQGFALFQSQSSSPPKLLEKQSNTALHGSRKSLVQDALRSFTGKLSYSPEVVLPDPTDPTAMLLLSSNIQKMSASLRTDAKANALWIGSNGESSLATLISEQEGARGSFPGPVPVIYCGGSSSQSSLDPNEIANAGAVGVLLPVKDGKAVNTLDDLISDDLSLSCDLFKLYTSLNLEVIPEITLSASFSKDCDMKSLVDTIISNLCDGDEPSALMISVAPDDNSIIVGKPSAKDTEMYEIEEDALSLPSVPKSLTKKVPLIFGLKCAANIVSLCAPLVKQAGFNGIVLRADCVPGGSRINPDLNFVGKFWAYIISDLKSLKSKAFGFRAKMDNLKLTKDIPSEWAKLQQDVAESGALGATSVQQDPSYKDVDDGASYKGF